jgi:hypothetical protein
VWAPAAGKEGRKLWPPRRARRGRRRYSKGASHELESLSWGIFVKRTQTTCVFFFCKMSILLNHRIYVERPPTAVCTVTRSDTRLHIYLAIKKLKFMKWSSPKTAITPVKKSVIFFNMFVFSFPNVRRHRLRRGNATGASRHSCPTRLLDSHAELFSTVLKFDLYF